MEVLFKFKRISTAGDLKTKLARFFQKIERRLGDFRGEFRKVWVEIRKERGSYRVKGTMRLPGKEIVVEEEGKSLIAVVTKVRNGLLRAISRYKKK